jgi:hypothetical protein
MPRKARIDAPGAPHHIIIRGFERKAIFKDDLKTAGNESILTKARTTLCYLAVRKLIISCSDVARNLTISPATVCRATSLPNLKQTQKELLGS